MKLFPLLVLAACHPSPSPPSACGGDELYRVDVGRSDREDFTTELRITERGGWASREHGREERGCFGPDPFQRVFAAIDKPWASASSAPGTIIDCQTPWPVTRYFIRGSLVLEIGCAGGPDQMTSDAMLTISEALFDARHARGSAKFAGVK